MQGLVARRAQGPLRRAFTEAPDRCAHTDPDSDVGKLRVDWAINRYQNENDGVTLTLHHAHRGDSSGRTMQSAIVSDAGMGSSRL